MTAGDASGAPGLFVSDIDGTLVTPDKQLTSGRARGGRRAEGGRRAVHAWSPAARRAACASIVEALGLQLPFAAFNGGNIVDPAGRLVGAHRLAPQVARSALELIAAHGVAPWAFADDAWFVTDPDGPHVAHERMTVSFDPTVVADFEAIIDRIDKIVAPSDDTPRLDGVEAALREQAGRGVQHRALADLLRRRHPSARQQGPGGAGAGRAGRAPTWRTPW